MAVIRITRRPEEGKNGKAPLYAVFYCSREKVRVPIKISVSAQDWDARGEKIRGRSQDVKDNNLIIENTRARISDVLVSARLRHQKLTKESFYRAYNSPSDYRDFYAFVDALQRIESRTLADNTCRQHTSVIKKLKTYRPGLAFHELTPQMVNGFVSWLRKIGNKEATVWKNIKTLKSYVNAAEKAGYIQDNPFASIKIRSVKNEIVFLDEDELKKLLGLYNSNRYDGLCLHSLRFFLFLCFTSLHIGDALKLRIEDIHNGELHYVRKKTRLNVCVPLSDPASKLVEFYRDGRSKGLLIPRFAKEQTINRKLKDICKEAGIDKPVSCKAGRHTVATLYYKKNRDILTLQNILGHSSLRMTMIYAHVVDDVRTAGVHAFDGLL